MKRMVLVLAVVACLGVTGCGPMGQVKKDWMATGGSRADAVVRLSFEHYPLEKPIVDEWQALSLAKERCKSWGYDDVEAFGGVINRRDPFTGITLVTKEYQCLGRGDSVTSAEDTKKKQ